MQASFFLVQHFRTWLAGRKARLRPVDFGAAAFVNHIVGFFLVQRLWTWLAEP